MSAYEDVLESWKSDVDTIEHLDFEPSLGCEARNPTRCTQTASFVMRFRCCGHSFLVCAEHRRTVEQDAARFGAVGHPRCGALEATLDALVEFIRIGGAS